MNIKATQLHVNMCCNSWYICLPFSAKQQREITKFCFVYMNHDNIFKVFIVNLTLQISQIQLRDSFDSDLYEVNDFRVPRDP